jgi:hypothetical protein
MYETYIYDPKACRGPLLARRVTVSLKTHVLGIAIRTKHEKIQTQFQRPSDSI